MNDIAEFIKKYGKPYDLETDNYDVPPFQENIDNASKSSAIYNMHMYWTKQDPYVVKRYIEHYTKPGDIVLDAFAGTGMTGVAAMMAGRHAILCEISPACIHIAKNYTTPIDPHILKSSWWKLREKIEPEIRPLYKTRCHNCRNTDAQIANIILSDVLCCPRCNAEVLYAGDGRWEQMKRGEKFKKIRCSNCKAEFTKANADFVRVEPIEIRVDCKACRVKGEAKAKLLDEEDWELYISIEGGPMKVIHEGEDEWSGYKFEPVERFLDDLGTKVYQKMLQHRGVDCILPDEVPYWYPKDVKFFGKEPMRNHKRGITHPYQMFSRRNLIALSIFWHYINGVEDEKVQEKLRFAFTANLFNVSIMYKWRTTGKGGVRAGTLYIPSVIQDMQTWAGFCDKVAIAIAQVPTSYSSGCCLGLAHAQNLSVLQSASIDYAYYDPPYGANINYSELNTMWEAWLGELTDTHGEIIENEAQGKGRIEYEAMMTQALREAYRVLKLGRWLSIIYSYTDPSMYRTVQKMAHEAGFVDEGEVLHVNSTMKTKSQLDSDKTQQRFLVINFKKPKNGERKQLGRSEDIELQVIQVIQEFLTKHSGRRRDQIYDEVIKRLFSSVQIEKFDLDEILKNFFRKVGNEWFAPGTLIERRKGDQKQGELWEEPVPEHPEKEVILRLQDFLRDYHIVPYSELREFYLRKLNIVIEKDFDDLVNENFIVDKGKVRLPKVEEQLRMQDITVHYTKRVIAQFLDGRLNRAPTGPEIYEWIQFCYKHELYKEGLQLFGVLDESSMPSDAYKKIKKIVEVCRIRMG
jgi:hypothetical protein